MNIGFDLDQTLLNFNKCKIESLIQVFIDHKIFSSREDERLEKFLNTYEQVSKYHWEKRGEKPALEVIQFSISDALKNYGVSFDEYLISQRYWELFCCSSYLEPGAIEILDALSKKHQLFCMTNGYSESQRSRLRAANLEHYFEEVFISEELGIAKPNPKALEVCLEKLELNKEETIYIGDSLKNDYLAANGAGIHFYFYNPTNIETTTNKGLTQFSHLKDLLDIL
ncbi:MULTISPECIES: HAD family hydrolase [Bacillus cereus group]|uniref:HAD-superfamily hydrolase, subfamily IA, variant 1 n=1 Tax=Bacillus cytotoxicus (strain DSM 22905 / CIP 110041 / 391-98 / NVH 391-98) TaxID=315749 RepID=A7GK69_BACCN|nr:MULTISPECIES: HAD-IA family hydrolase [Bacillus cereus group]ABS20527.1 HAD-superfamily hydrolase, subfamily IA, variant 1 [Bacillus cytotoxicus NVH 391-98]AWC43273.1 hypothetical protein CG479_000975 [Bacillus cytotoxicus]MDH2865589.1 HAD-IA family hydrolase [Bacillus cytotoxicus]MDH2882533.1 HAD-IA family hydrolase [Bacillus cytotoxicus]MDH2885604.1 HAD-IA family hydrolase [Bacillus cytotoxicus]